MPDQKIGVVTHYYDKLAVAVVKMLSGNLKVGDEIKFKSSDGTEFTQKVESMQLEHTSIDTAKKGDEFGLKVEKETKPKTEIFKAK